MSLRSRNKEKRWDGFPRVSGDEPDLPFVFAPNGKFSPRERG